MTPGGDPAVRIWADWTQRDAAGRVWTLSTDTDEPDRLSPGLVVAAGPPHDIRSAMVVAVLVQPWRSVVLLREVQATASRDDRPGAGIRDDRSSRR